MPTSTVTSKGQVTIPASVRAALGLRTGSRVAFVPTSTGSFEMVAEVSSVRAIRGLVPPPAVPVTIEEMDEAVAEGVAESLTR